MATYRCDIIVVTWNKLSFIKECVEAILRHTDARSRLIVVDNASDEDTRSYLKGLKGNEMVDIKLIFNDKNLGPGKARNIALKLMDADCVCFVDSDCTVTPNWLSNMLAVAESNPGVGMVNPSSNNFNQMPPKGTSLDEYARSLAPLKDTCIEVGHCISFCMLIKREVVEEIGFIDEEYILALYEDTDYSMKASSAGYRCVLARSSYVWHHGHGSTGRVRKLNAIAEKNKERFYKKWGRPLRVMWCLTAREKKKEVTANCIELARDGNFVYLFAQGTVPPINHANVHVVLYGRNFKWLCLWRLVTKRKKPFDLVVADEGIDSLLKRFRFFYKAEVIGSLRLDKILELAYDLKHKGL